MNWQRLSMILVLAFVMTAFVSQDAYSQKKKDKAPKETAQNKKEAKTVSSKGLFESSNMHEIELRPDYWTSFKIEKVVEIGTFVKKGDVLIEFDAEDLDKKIEELEKAKKFSDYKFKEFKLSYDQSEASYNERLKNAEIKFNRFVEDHNRYMKFDLPLAKKKEKLLLKTAESRLEGAKDSLKQLKRMYEEDELTEETEKMVLKRYISAVKTAEHGLESAKQGYEKAMKVTYPRMVKTKNDALKAAKNNWAKTKISMPHQREQLRSKMKDTLEARKKEAENLENLKKERQTLMVVKAPTDGYVYYGKCVKGKWASSAQYANKLVKGGHVNKKEVFMTIVPKGQLFVRTSFPEAQLDGLKVGLKGTIIPTAFSKIKIPVTLKKIALVPVSQGTYEAIVSIDEGADIGSVMAGMSGQLKFGIDQ